MASKKKYYAVAAGRATGVFSKWFGSGGAEEQVRGFAGARYKGFATLEEAQSFLDANKGRRRSPAPRRKRVSKPKTGAPRQAPRAIRDDQIVIYTDGGALNNPGPGGYGAVIAIDGGHKEYSQGFRLTTNNRMELLACIVALSAIEAPSSIVLHSDSKYVINGITKGWARKWRANGWMRTKQDPAVNPDLWERLLVLCEHHDVEFRWVKGHAGIEGNERCDSLATRAASQSGLPPDTVYEETIKHG